MKTPLNTWISVKDAMPPKKKDVPKNCDLIFKDRFDDILHFRSASVLDHISQNSAFKFWMLLSKETK